VEVVADEAVEDEAEVVEKVVEAVVVDEEVSVEEEVVEPEPEDDVEFCIVTVHVFTSCTASFP